MPVSSDVRTLAAAAEGLGSVDELVKTICTDIRSWLSLDDKAFEKNEERATIDALAWVPYKEPSDSDDEHLRSCVAAFSTRNSAWASISNEVIVQVAIWEGRMRWPSDRSFVGSRSTPADCLKKIVWFLTFIDQNALSNEPCVAVCCMLSNAAQQVLRSLNMDGGEAHDLAHAVFELIGNIYQDSINAKTVLIPGHDGERFATPPIEPPLDPTLYHFHTISSHLRGPAIDKGMPAMRLPSAFGQSTSRSVTPGNSAASASKSVRFIPGMFSSGDQLIAVASDTWFQVDPVVDRVQIAGVLETETQTFDEVMMSATAGTFILTKRMVLWADVLGDDLAEVPAEDLIGVEIPYAGISRFSSGPVGGKHASHYLSIHTPNEVFKFFPFHSVEIQELVKALAEATQKAPFAEHEYVKRVLEHQLDEAREEVLHDLLQETEKPWIETAGELHSTIKRISSGGEGPQLMYQLERLYHSCRQNAEVTSVAVHELQRAFQRAQGEPERKNILMIVDRLLDRAIMLSSDAESSFRALSRWLERVEHDLDPYRNRVALSMILALRRRATELRECSVAPMYAFQIRERFAFLESYLDYLKPFRPVSGSSRLTSPGMMTGRGVEALLPPPIRMTRVAWQDPSSEPQPDTSHKEGKSRKSEKRK